MTLIEALNDVNLFRRYFKAESWGPWKVFIAALFAASIDKASLALYRQCTGREAWPANAFIEAALIVGRRGGKSRILALIAVFLACFRDYSSHLAPGEVATIAILAVDRDQARAIFRFVLGLLQAVPLLAPLIVRKDAETIELSNRVSIEIRTASFRTTRGYTLVAALADELAFWRSDETSLNPDVEILRALRPGLASIPGGMLLIASSPYAKRGELYSAYRRHFGKDDAKVLVWKADTQTMNPSIDMAVIAEAYERDPESARAEFGAEFRSDLADFVSQETVDACTMWGRRELPPMEGVSYSAFVDPSGGISDAMTLAVGHLSRDNVCILDAVADIRPPFNPEDAVRECADLLRRYRVSTVVGDRYGGEWPRQRFHEHGIEFVQSARPKSDLYRDFLFLLNSGRVELLDYPRLAHELCGLERRTARSGRDSIDHAPGAHDDVANACAGCLVGLDLDRRPALVKINTVVRDEEDDGLLPISQQMAALTIIDAGPDLGVVYWSSARSDGFIGGMARDETLHVLDLDTLYFSPGLFDELARKLAEFAIPWGAKTVAFVPEHLIPRIGGRCHAIALPVELLAHPERFVTSAADYIAQKQVRFCAPARAKMQSQPIAAAISLRAGDEIEKALQTALVATIAVRFNRALA
jgi:hypothetical protein